MLALARALAGVTARASASQVRRFQEVQDVLDRNRVLIAEIHHNHQVGSQIALERNVPMLRELNGNVEKAVALYEKAAQSFADVSGSEYAAAGPAPGPELAPSTATPAALGAAPALQHEQRMQQLGASMTSRDLGGTSARPDARYDMPHPGAAAATMRSGNLNGTPPAAERAGHGEAGAAI